MILPLKGGVSIKLEGKQLFSTTPQEGAWTFEQKSGLRDCLESLRTSAKAASLNMTWKFPGTLWTTIPCRFPDETFSS
ncbi:hypothetical protein LEMLEM_LOCUS16344 [Lemmus lemmus]